VRISVRGVLFDLDGTLVDSGPAIVRSWVRFAIDFGIGLDELVAGRGHGRRSEDVIAGLVPVDRRTAAFDRVHDLELTDLDDLVPVAGAIELLAALPRAAWGIVTSGSRDLASARLRAAGLADAVDRLLVTGQDVSHGKPHPDPYLAGARALGLAPGECLAVEDAAAGVASATAAGMRTLAVTITTPPALLTADAVVSDLSAVTVVTGGAGGGPIVLEVDTGRTPRDPVEPPVPIDLLEAASAAGDRSVDGALAAVRRPVSAVVTR
jgi:sugar-phosphatase